MSSSISNELETLQNENQLLRLKISELEDQLESLRRGREGEDPLEGFGLADERYFSRRLRESILAAERYARFVSVVLVGINNGKSDNSTSSQATLDAATKLRNELRETDLVAIADSGRVYLLLEEAEPHQAVLALRRVLGEMVNPFPADYCLACYPNDSNREETLLELLEHRLTEMKALSNEGVQRVHLGSEVLSLSN